MIIRWTGGPDWALVGPFAGIPNVNLSSVYCVSTSDCWAVGNGGLIMHWDGVAWSQVQAGLTVQDLREVYVIGPRQRPQSAWQEVVN